MKKIMILFALVMALSFPYSASAADPCSSATGLLIHWNFDNNLTNTGTTGSCTNINLSMSSAIYSTGVDLKTSGALNLTSANSEGLTSIMASVGTLNPAEITVSFYIGQGGKWSHVLFLASNVSHSYTFMVDDQTLKSSTNSTDPITKLKTIISSTIMSIGKGTPAFDGSIDEFRIYDSVLTVDQLKTIDFSLANLVNTDHSPRITIDEVVNFLSTHNTTDNSSIPQLLDLITPLVEPLVKPIGLG